MQNELDRTEPMESIGLHETSRISCRFGSPSAASGEAALPGLGSKPSDGRCRCQPGGGVCVEKGGRQSGRKCPGAGLQTAPHTAVPAFPGAKAKLVRLLRAGPRKAGFATDLWTLPRVTELIRRKFDVSYHSTNVGRLLHALGFSCQKPERRSKEQDPQAVQAWREKKWPAIKKGGT